MPEQFHFGEFTLDHSQYRLQRENRILRLEKRPMELLILLVQRKGELVSRHEIAERLWGKEVFLDVEHGINTAIRKVRRVLRDDSEKPRFIETVIGKGYRFAAPVTCATNGHVPSIQAEVKEIIQPRPPAILSDDRAPLTVTPQNVISKRKLFTITGITSLIFVVAVGTFLIRHRNLRPLPPPIKSLAVLPLKNLSGDPGQEYLVDGMTEALIGRLSAIHDLRVTSRTSVMRFKDTRLSVPEIADALHVDALVEGSVMRQGNQLRVMAQLIRGATDEHFWSATYDHDLPDVLALQSDVAQAIAQRVEATVTRKEEQRLTASHTVSPEAYESYLKGQFLLHTRGNTKAGVEESIQYFEQALTADPSFALAYLGLAEAHAALSSILIGGHPDTERAQVLSAARKALQLDPNLAEAHDLLGETALKQWRWSEAEAEYRLAIELNPNDSVGYVGLSLWLLAHGRFDDAMVYSERGRMLDRNGVANWGVAWVLFQARRYDDAIRELRSTLAVRPDDTGLNWMLGFVFVIKGQPKEAVPILEKAAVLSSRTSGTLDLLATAYARAGRRADALRLLHELNSRQQKGYVPAASFVIAYAGLGDKEQAFAWLEKCYQEQSAIMQWLKVHPVFDPLRNDPRFTDLVRRVGLN